MIQEPEELTAGERKEILGPLYDWRDHHPAPNQPALAFLGRDYSPHQIVEEVEEGTEVGNRLGRFLYQVAHEYQTTPQDLIRRSIPR